MKVKIKVIAGGMNIQLTGTIYKLHFDYIALQEQSPLTHSLLIHF